MDRSAVKIGGLEWLAVGVTFLLLLGSYGRT